MKHSLLFALLFLCGSLLPGAVATAQERGPLVLGDAFPEISLEQPESPIDAIYLGLSEKQKTFKPSQVAAELLLIEVLNVHCVHCQMQVPSYRELYRAIENDPVTKGRVKMFGLALGNLPEEVASFRRDYQVLFPVLADPQFRSYRELGVQSTPFTVYVRQDQRGASGVVADTHQGLNTNYQKVLVELKKMLQTDLSELREKGRNAKRLRAMITPIYSSEEELQTRVRNAFLNQGGMIKGFAAVPLLSGRRVYMANMQRGEEHQQLYAVVVSRQAVCDICHNVHFIYLFDRQAQIVGFEPLQATKYGNVAWNRKDTEKMRQRLVGQSLRAPRAFDPKVDAVTTATISSAIIFDTIFNEEKLLEELAEEGYF